MDIDDFIVALPMKEMNDLYVAICRGEDEHAHNFIWTLSWLEACMEISEVTQDEVCIRAARLKCINANLLRYREEQDEHIERFIAMEADPSTPHVTLMNHYKEGLDLQKRYNVVDDLATAMNKVDMLADQLKHQATGNALARSAHITALLYGFKTNRLTWHQNY
ncbi:unnamed protein product [Phytophthora fragariaefolia]|uniref:Unnamed protein product n=1 Tax=Phytophthora fragariaefolia TaxID=1490495 RepID=A0A9W6U9U6_9STRA|nr:unnamed protein product [Phytophthora fragariaefolia]